jgi:hypothetical protein
MEQSRIPQWNTKTKLDMEFFHTFSTQVELLPRISITYGFGDSLKLESEGGDFGIIRNGIAIEWLWFSLFITRKKTIKLK